MYKNSRSTFKGRMSRDFNSQFVSPILTLQVPCMLSIFEYGLAEFFYSSYVTISAKSKPYAKVLFLHINKGPRWVRIINNRGKKSRDKVPLHINPLEGMASNQRCRLDV